jgi:hypothetical protein
MRFLENDEQWPSPAYTGKPATPEAHFKQNAANQGDYQVCDFRWHTRKVKNGQRIIVADPRCNQVAQVAMLAVEVTRPAEKVKSLVLESGQ